MRSFLRFSVFIPNPSIRGIPLSIFTVTSCLFATPSLSQITPDSTLGSEGSIVVPNQTLQGLPADRISGGATRGANVFHSFLEFNVNDGQRVYFDNPTGIDRILTRVTGANLSNIAGTLGVLGNADLFLLNPNGILFGPNAMLDLKGSFIGSTAASLQFDGFQFSAISPTTIPLLTINVPLGLQYGQNSGLIEANGLGNHFRSSSTTITEVNAQGGLTVDPGKTLALLGGAVQLKGAALQAVEGQVALMGVAGTGEIQLSPSRNGWQFTPQDLTPQPIAIRGGSLVNANGGLQIYGSDLTLTDQSYVLSQMREIPSIGKIHVEINDRLFVSGTSAIVTETLATAAGIPLKLEARRIELTEGSRISSLTAGSGQSGTVTLGARETLQVQGQGVSIPGEGTQIRSSTLGAGNAGFIKVTAPLVSLQNGGVITSTSLPPGTGEAGEIRVQATEVQVEGVDPKSLFPSAIRSATLSSGNAGVVEIQSDRVIVTSGGRITALTANNGNAGEVRVIAAERITVTGSSPNQSPSLISAAANPLTPGPRKIFGLPDVPTGNSGALTLRAPEIWVQDGGVITTNNEGSGDAGTLSIFSDRLTLKNRGEISSTVLTGDGGEIMIETGDLNLDQGLINASVLSTGTGGNIQIRATGTIALTGIPIDLSASFIPFAQDPLNFLDTSQFANGLVTFTTNRGNGGQIEIQAQNLTMDSGTFITTSTVAEGNAGSIGLSIADQMRINDSYILTTAFNTGKAGDLRVTTQRLQTENGGLLASGNFGAGDGGQLTVIATESIDLADDRYGSLRGGLTSGSLLLSSDINPFEASGNGGDLTVQTPNLRIRNGAGLNASAEGSGNAGNITILSDRVRLETSGYISSLSTVNRGGDIDLNATEAIDINGGLFAVSQGTQGGNIRIQTPDLRISGQGELATSATGQGIAGNIELESDRILLDQGFVLANSNLGQGGNIHIRAKEWLALRNNSLISTQSGTAEFGGGNGGNIVLESPLILGSQNSDLIANAFQGDGGNISILTQSLFGFAVENVDNPLEDPRNNITASSRFGSSGSTNINNTLNPTTGLAPLTTALVDPSDQILDRCTVSTGEGNQFNAIGRGGLPASPTNWPTSVFLLPLNPGAFPQAQALQDQATLLFEKGHLEDAYATWEAAADRSGAVEDVDAQRSAYLNQLQMLQLLGFQTKAYQALSQLKDQVATEPQTLTKAVIEFQFGQSAQSIGALEQANAAFTEALSIAEALAVPQLKRQILLSLGHQARSQNQRETALAYYQQAATVGDADIGNADIGSNALTPFQANVSALDLALAQGKPDPLAVADLLAQALDLLPTRTSFYAQIHLATLLRRSLETDRPLATPAALLQLLQDTAQQAQTVGDTLSLVYSLREQGQVYKATQQWQQAQQLTQQALRVALPLNLPEVNYVLLWQWGQILQHQGQTQEAIVTYRQAVKTLQKIRVEIATNAPDVQFNFRDQVEPLYRQFVRLLLSSDTPSLDNLKEARNLIENLKLIELNDFFKDACTQTAPIAADQVDPTAAVIYPIILDDRLDVIVSLGQDEHLLHYSHPVSSETIRKGAQDLSKAFTASFRASSRDTHQKLQQFYNWLIQPAQEKLAENHIQTLVFIADGVLRDLPVSALYTGDHYLIEDYNIALSPGLNLMEPRPLSRKRLNLFAGGLSEVSPNFSNEFEPLPFVETELDAIAAIVPNHRVYLNEALQKSVLLQDLKVTPFNIVHLATHGEFGKSAENTYLLTWDRKLDLDEFSTVLQNRVQNPIELLVLSACETAAGNDRAVLGIAGMAIRTNAQSTIASLRRVDDEATAQMMDDFYQALVQPGTTKSQAFREAQLALLHNPLYASPYYWAPFVLVGNWF